ncbi:MAG: class I SAM-dependent methyltransferase [Parachlamydiales bacterium]
MDTDDQLKNNPLLKDLNDSKENVSNYSKFGIEGTSFLAFRDVPDLIRKYVQGIKTLDYGCGAGRSTRFLKSQGLDVIGVDISEKFLDACKKEAGIHYCKIENGKLPFIDNSYDFVFSSLVFLAIPSKQDIKTALREIHRILKDTGILIIVTGSEKLHSPEMKWLSYKTDFPENQNLSSGQVLKFHIRSANVTFYDYFWSNNDYLDVFYKSNFQVLKTLFPLGRPEDSQPWLSEEKNAPFAIYVLQKKN